MKLLLLSFTLLISTFSYAQRQSVYFLKNDGRYVDIRDSADYIRVVNEPDSASVLYNVFEFYPAGQRKLVGKSSTIYPPVFEGQCARFYKNGKRQRITTYKNGLPIGDEYEFYPNGKPYQVKTYPHSDGHYDANYYIKENYDSLGTTQMENGNGYYRAYDEKFSYVVEEGVVKNGKRDGSWKGSNKDLKNTFIETYVNGDLITGTATYEDGGSAIYTKSREVVPQFKGGLEAFYKYLGKTIRYPADAREDNIQGRVIVSFVVAKDGKVADVVVRRGVSKSLNAEALRVIEDSPAWVPGMRFGRAVRVQYSVPISFSLRRN